MWAVARIAVPEGATHEHQSVDLPSPVPTTVHRGTLRQVPGTAGIGRSVLARSLSDLEDESEVVLNDIRGASWAPRERSVEIAREDGDAHGNGHYEEGVAVRTARPQDLKRAARDSLRTMMLIRAYRVRGHLEASLDPLDLKPRAKHGDLDPRTLGFTEADMDRPIHIDNILGYESASLRQIVHVLRQTYCGNIGVEYMHIQNPDQRKWLQLRIEGSRNQRDFTDRGKAAILSG
jgi:2-oxoglutarate dehydrogenase E1 component